MVVVLSSHAVSTTTNIWQDQYYYLRLQKVSARNYKIQSCITSDEHPHFRWCEQLIKHKFPQCAPANLEHSCLLEIGDFSRKLRLRCSCQFPWCALAPTCEQQHAHISLSRNTWNVTSVAWRPYPTVYLFKQYRCINNILLSFNLERICRNYTRNSTWRGSEPRTQS
jgi:hypothetical protein